MCSKKIKFLVSLFMSLLFPIVPQFYAFEFAYETNVLSSKHYEASEQIPLKFILKSDENISKLESFKCEIKFDSEKLKYSKIQCSKNIKRRDIKIEKKDDALNLLFSPIKSREVELNDNNAEIFEVVFIVKSKVISGTTNLKINFKNLDNEEEIIHTSDCELYINGNPEIENCKLNSLTPTCGDLSPEFNSDVFDYTLEVPGETEYLEFDAVPMLEHLNLKINRTKLAPIGRDTDIKITVSNKAFRVKSVYNILVKRKEIITQSNDLEEISEDSEDIDTSEQVDEGEIENQNNSDCNENENILKASNGDLKVVDDNKIIRVDIGSNSTCNKNLPNNNSSNIKPVRLTKNYKKNSQSLTKKTSKKSGKPRTKKHKNKSKKYRTKNSTDEGTDDAKDDREGYIQEKLKTHNVALDSNLEVTDSFDNVKIYWIIISIILSIGVFAYFVIKFVKLKKEKSHNISKKDEDN